MKARKSLFAAMGTWFRCEVFLDNEVGGDELFSGAQNLVTELEALWSRRLATSDISLINSAKVGATIRVHPNTQRLIHSGLKIQRLTEARFRLSPLYFGESLRCEQDHVIKLHNSHLDLDGIAKGMAADLLAEYFLKNNPISRGTINAGGDIRRFGNSGDQIFLRLGSPRQVFIRSLVSKYHAVATSSLYARQLSLASSTKYWPGTEFAENPDCEYTFVALAEECALADALNKFNMSFDFLKLPMPQQKKMKEVCGTADCHLLKFNHMGELLNEVAPMV